MSNNTSTQSTESIGTPHGGVYQTYHDWTGSEPLSHSVTEAVATVTTTEFDQLEQLYDAIDPESLDALFQPVDTGPGRMDGCVSFTFNDCTVEVFANGRIRVRILDGKIER